MVINMLARVGLVETHVFSKPNVVFVVLAADYGQKMDWSKVHFYWGDERCVPPADEESNFRMTVDHLFSKIEVTKEKIHSHFGENDNK